MGTKNTVVGSKVREQKRRNENAIGKGGAAIPIPLRAEIAAFSYYYGTRRAAEEFLVTSRFVNLINNEIKALRETQPDDEYLELFEKYKQELASTVKSIGPLVVYACSREILRRIPIAKTEADAKILHSLGGLIKICGELEISRADSNSFRKIVEAQLAEQAWVQQEEEIEEEEIEVASIEVEEEN